MSPNRRCACVQSGVPSFEWHILMEYCDKGSLSKMLASFKWVAHVCAWPVCGMCVCLSVCAWFVLRSTRNCVRLRMRCGHAQSFAACWPHMACVSRTRCQSCHEKSTGGYPVLEGLKEMIISLRCLWQGKSRAAPAHGAKRVCLLDGLEKGLEKRHLRC